MRSRSFAALAAVSVLVFAACGDDDEDAGGETTGVVSGAATQPAAPEGADTTELGAAVTTAAAGVETSAAVAGVETSAAAAGVETSAAAAGVETSAAAAGVETSAAAAGVETSAAAAGVETSAAAAGAETSAAAGVDTSAAVGVETSAAVAAAATTEAAAVTTELAAETSAAPEATTEAAAVTSETAAETTEAAAETTEAAAETTSVGVDTIEAAAATTAATGTTDPAAETTTGATGTTEAAATETTEAGAATSAPESAPATSEPGSSVPAGEPGASVPAGEPGAITVGSANFPESELLAQIYGQALEAAGFDVTYELGIGAREAYLGAVEGGEVGLVPEYTGSLLAFISDEPPTAANVEEQVAAIGEELPEGLEVLEPSSAEDKDTIVCTQEVVDEFGLTDLSSLFENSENITLGAPPEFETRSPFGLAGFSEVYGAEFAEFVPLAPGDIPAALEAGEIDCGNIFSTDPAIDTGGFVALEDDQAIVPNEAVLPLVRSELVTPEMEAALDEVNAALDTETLTGLVAQVVNEQLGADVVAEEFLASLGE